jgi:hypothetical protein
MSKSRRINSISLPAVNASFTLHKRFRFMADAAVTDISIDLTCIRELFGLAYHSALPSNGMYRLIDAFRIRSVDVYSIPAMGTSSTVALDWASSNSSRSNRISDTSLGVQPAHVHASPPPNSAPSFWQNSSGSTVMFKVTVPSGGILDLSLDLVFVDTGGQFLAVTNTVTDGSLYIKPLDSVLSSYQGHLLPVSYPNVILV